MITASDTIALIDLKSITHNLSIIKKIVGNDVTIMAVKDFLRRAGRGISPGI